jgi:pimeloyl-ACP methyl ester carboxylesterase
VPTSHINGTSVVSALFGRFRATLAILILLSSVGALPALGQITPPLERLTVTVTDHPFRVWARRPPEPRGAIVLLHGRSWSGRPNYDFQWGDQKRNVLMALAAAGYAAYALDLRGYGETPRDATGWVTPDQASRDVAGVIKWVTAQHPNLGPPVLFGWSWGARIAALFASRSAEPVRGLVLYGFTYDPDAAIPADVPASATPPQAPNTRANAVSDFITPGSIPPDAVEAYADGVLAADPIRADWRALDEQRKIQPSAIRVPTLIIQGERDPGIKPPVVARFFTQLGAPSRQWIVLGGGDHAAILEDTHGAFIAALVGFLNQTTSTHP